MKILVVSLLRLGDIIMATPLLASLKAKYPKATIHILINKQFYSLSDMLPNVDKMILFDRQGIQEGLGDGSKPFFEPYDRVNGLIQDLNAENYDWIINVTHNKLSGWLVGMVECERKDGLSLQNDGSPQFGSKWFELLNFNGSAHKESSFHFVDIFCYGAGLKNVHRKITLQETEKGMAEAQQLTRGLEPYICLQPTTSDSKKDWGDHNFLRFVELTSQVDAIRSYILLGAPAEKERLEKLSVQLHERKIKHKLCICGLDVAFTIIKNSDLLITGDTGIKHLAAATRTQIIELSMGSSSYERTGAYSDRAIILQSLEPCAPCGHSEKCPYESHRCAHSIAPECVALVCQSVLAKAKEELRTIASEFSDQVKILRTEFSNQGEWKACPIVGPFETSELMGWIDRSSQRLFLNDANSDMIEYGTESLQLEKLFLNLFPDREKYQWVETYKTLESSCDSFRSELENALSELKLVIRNFESEKPFANFKDRVSKLTDDSYLNKHFKSYTTIIRQALKDDMQSESKFSTIKKMRELITSLYKRIEIESRIIKSLRTQMLERV